MGLDDITNSIWFNIEYGMHHVLDANAYDHLLFLASLSLPYSFKHWKKLFFLVSLFTLGHTLSLTIASYQLISVNDAWVEFLIPLTILFAASINLWQPVKIEKKKGSNPFLLISALAFGVIHGFGFAREFRMYIGSAENKFIPLVEFALGIEIAQVLAVLVVASFGLVVQTFFRVSKRDYILVLTSIGIGLTIPLLLSNKIW